MDTRSVSALELRAQMIRRLFHLNKLISKSMEILIIASPSQNTQPIAIFLIHLTTWPCLWRALHWKQRPPANESDGKQFQIVFIISIHVIRHQTEMSFRHTSSRVTFALQLHRCYENLLNQRYKTLQRSGHIKPSHSNGIENARQSPCTRSFISGFSDFLTFEN